MNTHSQLPPAPYRLPDLRKHRGDFWAQGGDLSPESLLNAYAAGIFPWFMPGTPLQWHSPATRCIMRPEQWKPSKSLRATLRKSGFTVRVDTAFEAVLDGCAAPRSGESGTWIGTEMREAYLTLHRQGWAHCFETWSGDRLVGGLYGLSLGRMFMGESMFSAATDASKVAWDALMRWTLAHDFAPVDGQIVNNHLLSLGAEAIPRAAYLELLDEALQHPTLLGPWPDPTSP